MKKRYRVLRVGELYYPQYLWLGVFWLHCTYKDKPGSFPIELDSLERAYNFLKAKEYDDSKKPRQWKQAYNYPPNPDDY